MGTGQGEEFLGNVGRFSRNLLGASEGPGFSAAAGDPSLAETSRPVPAIDPTRLEKQVGRVTEAFAEPSRLRRRCLDVLEFYASRVRQSGEGGGRTGAGRSLGVPVAVLRELERVLRVSAAADSHAAAMAAEALWATPVQEARLLAIALLDRQPVDDLPSWVQAWVQTADDSLLLERLASGPLRHLRQDNLDLFWQTLAAYIQSRAPSQVTIGLLALQDAVAGVDAGDLPRVFALLAQAPPPQAGEAWRAQVEVLREIARRSPAEAARHLVDEIERGRPGSTRLTRQVLNEFPPRQQEALRQSLRLGAGR